ncbi:DUF1893 domain-containing protein [Chloroflexota bacterium]
MYQHLFNKFLTSNDTLRVYEGEQLIFSSRNDRLLPLLDYLDQFTHHLRQVTIFDKIMGNAAALLSVKANCQETYSPLGSQLAVKTLDQHGIRHHLTKIVPYIQKPGTTDMCPMEKLSIGKGAEEFYEAMMSIINKPREN